jgi:oxygen-independent coproporphyrinogen-3 oxidase
MPAYVDALIRELARWGERLNSPPVRTIFFGGGTPSYLPTSDLDLIIRSIECSFVVSDSAEITLECNPGDVTQEKASAWLSSRINRVSMGVQSFDDDLLESLTRRHSSDDVYDSAELLRQADLKNLSIDLIYGLPDQSLDQWSDTLSAATELGTEHISLYSLQIEQGTPLAIEVASGRVPEPDDDLAADMYELAQAELPSAGLNQYEISNWSKPGFEAHHNVIYWKNEPYLGVGPGAHSWLDNHRFANLRSPRQYALIASSGKGLQGISPVESMSHPGGPVEQVETTTPELDIAETMMMGMRLNEGVQFDRFVERFGKDVREVFPAEFNRLTKLGLIESSQDSLRLTPRGILLGNEVFAEFVGG